MFCVTSRDMTYEVVVILYFQGCGIATLCPRSDNSVEYVQEMCGFNTGDRDGGFVVFLDGSKSFCCNCFCHILRLHFGFLALWADEWKEAELSRVIANKSALCHMLIAIVTHCLPSAFLVVYVFVRWPYVRWIYRWMWHLYRLLQVDVLSCQVVHHELLTGLQSKLCCVDEESTNQYLPFSL